MEKVRNDKNLPEQTEEFSHPDDWWLDEEDSADGLPVFDPDEAEDYAKDRQRLMGVPMVTGYEALERHRGVRRPRRKLSRREKRAWKKAQKYEMKLHKAHEKEERKLAKQAAKQAAREEKAAQKQAKKEEKHKKKTVEIKGKILPHSSPFHTGKWEKTESVVWRMGIIQRRFVFMISTISWHRMRIKMRFLRTGVIS